ncbi:hypothetical protein [Sphingomonas radiodurans]|uniref:hypothetical protein n=1 Tax=Sphingomonas radiodurans TaxID=2890321 RepID=UPI001E33ECD2|nr:hypothetical protein [Sphingomonas radiodurans]WBH17696.1 hypothetical protein LLW23_06230 [Sphingomonas radiodurans]
MSVINHRHAGLARHDDAIADLRAAAGQHTNVAMDAFSYLSVLLSIILGLAITQVLQGIRGLMLSRRHVALYPPVLLWAGTILLMAVQMWWASFGLADHAEWTFAEFGIVLVQTTLLYMLAALVLPDIKFGEPADLRAHYYRETRPFFGILVAILLVSVLKDLLIDGYLPSGANLAFHVVFATVALACAISHHRRLHEAGAVAIAALLVVYIAVLFARLK